MILFKFHLIHCYCVYDVSMCSCAMECVEKAQDNSFM